MAKKKASKKRAKKVRRKIQAYAFIDTNIFLDFYRGKTEASLSLLEKLESVRDRIICTYQVEMEFLKNRQNQIRNIANESNLSIDASLPAVLSDTQLSESVERAKKDFRSKKQQLRKGLLKLLSNPSSDRVYNVLEDVFRSESEHVLTRDMPIKNKIKRLARRRFQLGYPPRKAKDTSMGDALNWEWIIHCANVLKGRFIIVTRDSDYGATYDGKFFLNDQLKREFRERVGRKSIVFTQKLSDALNELNVRVTAKEKESEARVIRSSASSNSLQILRNALAHSPSAALRRELTRANHLEFQLESPLAAALEGASSSNLERLLEALQHLPDDGKD